MTRASLNRTLRRAALSVGFVLLLGWVLVKPETPAWLDIWWKVAAGIDPLDRFRVLRVVSDDRAERHAVIVAYHHADSSSDDIAVWVISGAAPAIGSEDPIPGKPILAWTGSPDKLNLAWKAEHQRLSMSIEADMTVSEQPSSCFFMDPHPSNVLCYDPSAVELLKQMPPRDGVQH